MAGETAAPPADPADAIPAKRRALREFDRFLDHHPLIEENLRLDPLQTFDPAYLGNHVDLREFLRANPNVAEGLKLYPRYFLNRALLRQANAPISFADLAPLKDLFNALPELEQDLNQNPELIRDRTYLAGHPALRDCLAGHPVLARVFLRPGGLTSN